jgi:hypothetical protein
MPKLDKTEWYRLAKAKAALESMGMAASATALARHTDFSQEDISATLADETFSDFAGVYKQRRFGLWADSLSKAGAEIQQLMKVVGFKALMAVDDLLDSDDDKVRVSAARLAFDFNPDMERPVVRHEITNRFTADEINQARDIVRKLKEPKVKLPELPNGDSAVN